MGDAGIMRSVNDLEISSLIGEGSYAQVWKATEKKTDNVVAVKQLDKQLLMRLKKAQYALSEKEILVRCTHPNIIKLHYTLQDQHSLYFVLEYCANGDLFELVRKFGRLTEEQTRFFAAELLLALEHLHIRNIIHRDIKPENMLLDDKFHLKLIDFSSAKIMGPSPLERAKSFTGTAEYTPPELLTPQGVGRMGDIWALGCTVYQLLSGQLPFKGSSEYNTYQTILECKPAFPEHFSPAATDFLRKVLVPNPEERLGVHGFAELKAHPFFEGIDWENIQRVDSPLISMPSERVN
eukprot:TRINITY_DN1420_c0_g1_i1.p1 TRINITY_DN1420_c0_g1~~TRINITY_DN1420_c0_g1_i1.p1  ORF type:complete len:294 (+),score=45.16 TRINITY_DN1420_c0_g1_i1:54-935(+)